MTVSTEPHPLSPFSALRQGASKIWFQKKMLLWLYLLNLLFAGVMVYPLRSAMSELSKTDLSADFVTGFRIDSFVFYWSDYSSTFKSLFAVAVGMGVLYMIFNIFIAGGMVAALSVDRRVTLRRFFSDSSRYFWRFCWLFIFMAVGLGLIATAYDMLLSETIDEIQKAATTDRASFLWQILGVAIVVLGCTFVLMIFDYARICTVADRRRNCIATTFSALRFSLRKCWRTIPLFGFNLLIVVLLFAIYLLVENLFSNATLASMIGLFVFQQLFILSRIWMRFSFYSSQMAYYQSIR